MLGLGIALDPNHLTVEALHAAVDQVYNTPSYREHVQPYASLRYVKLVETSARPMVSAMRAHRQKEIISRG